MKKAKSTVALALILSLTGCATGGSNQTAGTLLGGVSGALVGSQFGKGKGQLVGVAIGTMLGAIAGGSIGKNEDERGNK